jgi:hypothetical protein
MSRPIDRRPGPVAPVHDAQVHNAAQAKPSPAAGAAAPHHFGQYNGAVFFVLPRGAQRSSGAAAGKGPTARRSEKGRTNAPMRKARRGRTATLDPESDDFSLSPEDDDDVAVTAELGSSFSQQPREPLETDAGREDGIPAAAKKAAWRVPIDDTWAKVALTKGGADAVLGSFVKRMFTLADSGTRGGAGRSTVRRMLADAATVMRTLGPGGLAGTSASARVRSLLIDTADAMGRRPAATAEARTINLLMFPRLLIVVRYCTPRQHGPRVGRAGVLSGSAPLPHRISKARAP